MQQNEDIPALEVREIKNATESEYLMGVQQKMDAIKLLPLTHLCK